MIKNIVTAPEDALFIHESPKNPISTGLLTPKQARIVTLIVAVISLILYIFLGTWPLIFGLTVMLVGFISAYQETSLKSMAVVEVLSHSLMLAALPFMIGHFAFTKQFNQAFFWLLGFILAVSLYEKLDQPTTRKQDNTISRRSQTTAHLNKRTINILMLMMLIIAILTGVVALFIDTLIPMWVAILILVMGIILSIPRVIKTLNAGGNLAKQGVFKQAMEAAAALGLFLQFLIPWISKLLSIELF